MDKQNNNYSDNDAKQIQNFIKRTTTKTKTRTKTKTMINQRRQRQQQQRTFSKESRIFIEKIFHYMEKARLTLSLNTFHTENLSGLPKGEYYHLLESSIKTEIENRMRIFKKTTFQIGDRRFQIYMSFHEDTDIKQWLIYIHTWLHVACQFAISSSCSKHLSIYIYYTGLKKTLPKIDKEPIDYVHANTAFTFACSSPNNTAGENEIYIYRIEEWFKVLIHESMHSFGLDFAAMDQTSVEKRICNDGDIYQMPTCNDLRFYESYTEMWAELLQSMFAVFYREGGSEFTVEENITLLEDYVFGYEAPFSAFQCAKVLGHFGLSYNDLFDRNKTMQYREKTPVFSYYVIKSVFMNHADEFILWCMHHNGSSIQFKKTHTNIQRLAELLKSLCRNPTYLKKMETVQKVIMTSSKSIDTLLANTMRMSCISLFTA